MQVKLPNGHRADLGRKLEEYVLSTLHREGRHKARVFDSVLGVSLANQGVLRQAILEAAAASEEVESHGDSGHGTVTLELEHLLTAQGDDRRLDVDRLERAPVPVALGVVHRPLPLDRDVYWHYGNAFRFLQANGLLIGANDLWIAAAGLAHGIPVVSRNARHFARVPGLSVVSYT